MRVVLTPSIGTTLASRKSVGPGFDVLRVALALSVIGWHSIYITQGVNTVSANSFLLPRYVILSMFFGPSGFLITASTMRLSLANFIINRGLRIVPALFVEVILSAVLLGAALTTLPPPEYFRATNFGATSETWQDSSR